LALFISLFVTVTSNQLWPSAFETWKANDQAAAAASKVAHFAEAEKLLLANEKLAENLSHQSAENCPHLLETHCHFPPALFSSISDHGEMRGLDFYPLCLRSAGMRGGAKTGHAGKGETQEPSNAKDHGHELWRIIIQLTLAITVSCETRALR